MEKTGKEKAKLLSQALGACGLGITDESAYIVLEAIEVLKVKGDKFSLRDASVIEAAAIDAYAKPKSTKVKEIQECEGFESFPEAKGGPCMYCDKLESEH